MRDSSLSRRHFLGAGGLPALSVSAGALLSGDQVFAGEVPRPGEVRITNIETFSVEVPATKEEKQAGMIHRVGVVRVHTDSGIVGTCFSGGPSREMLEGKIRPALVGKDLFALDRHIQAGMNDWAAVEHAIWDAIGLLLKLPAYKLLGGSRDRVKAYFTAVWPGKPDQSHVSYEAQAAYALKLKQAGFAGMKIRAWRPNPMDDVDAAGVIREAVGDDFALMYDRTAHHPGKVWDYETALRVAKGFKKHGVTWLEEPFDRKDLIGPRRLARESGMVITGGEGGRGLEPFRDYLVADTYDILQPDGINAGGLFTIRKIAALAEAFGRPCILHGSTGLRQAGFVQEIWSNVVDGPLIKRRGF